MTVVLAHAEPAQIFEPLTWQKVTELPSMARVVWAVCGNGHRAMLDDHVISADGSVTPSLVCPEPGCGWHENVKLEGWTP